MQNPDEPRKEKNLAAGARTPDSTDQVEHATSAPPPVLWLPFVMRTPFVLHLEIIFLAV